MQALRPRPRSISSSVSHPPLACLPAPTYEAGVVVLVCLALVLQDLLANVLCALVKGIVHAIRPGD